MKPFILPNSAAPTRCAHYRLHRLAGAPRLPLLALVILQGIFTPCLTRPQSISATSISFQGALTGSNGQPLPNGPYNLTFKFYDVPTGGLALGTSNVPNVPVAGGIASTPIPVDAAWFDGH